MAAMVLVDTSIWIELFGRRPRFSVSQDQLLRLATCPPVLQELVQGFADDAVGRRLRAGVLALPCVSRAVSHETYLHAADIYRRCRRGGATIRSSVDCLVAAIAVEADLPVWHKDRDYDQIARFTDLKTIKRL